MTTFPAPYSTASDLLFSETTLVLGAGFDKQKFVTTAAEDMDAKLGFLYVLPLTPDPDLDDDAGNPLTTLPTHEQLLLKSINNKLASGRIFMTIRGSADGDRQHVYGTQLVNEAIAELMMLANGDVALSAIRKADGTQINTASQRSPKITNHDSDSLVDGFEEMVFRNNPQQVFPGGAF